MAAPSALVIEDWLYHAFHLAGALVECGDCRVCAWYRRLSEATRRRYK